MWQLEYSQEASNYALDSHPYNEGVLMAIEDLVDSEDGLPADANWTEWRHEHYLWVVAGHLVSFQRFRSPTPRLLILFIKPLE